MSKIYDNSGPKILRKSLPIKKEDNFHFSGEAAYGFRNLITYSLEVQAAKKGIPLNKATKEFYLRENNFSSLEDLVQKIEEKLGTKANREYYWVKNNMFFKADFFRESFGCSVIPFNSNYVKINFCSADEEIWEKFFDFISELKVKEEKNEEKSAVYVMISSQQGIDFSFIGNRGEPLVRNNYSNSVLEEFDYICSEFQKPSPIGRLAILQGEPGTGKTYLIRGIINEIKNCSFIIVPPRLISSLGDPSFLPSLVTLYEEGKLENIMEVREGKKHHSIIMILEDADEALIQRDAANMAAISTILNFADGIVGKTLDIRILASTNASIKNMDAAMERPGRLLTKFNVDKLEPEKANKILEKLLGDRAPKLDKPMTLAEIYDKVNGSKTKERKQKEAKIGFF